MSTQDAAALENRVYEGQRYLNKEYYMLYLNLSGFLGALPELVHLTFTDNGSFSLSSNFFTKPASGTYEKNIFLLKGQGQTGKFFDKDMDEDIEMSYRFTGMPIGFRNFFMLGIGLREIKFYGFAADNQTTLREPEYTESSVFIFEGPGF